MGKQAIYTHIADSFQEPAFLRKLGMNRSDALRLFGGADWSALLSSLLPVHERVSCAAALEAFRPLLDQLTPEPSEGWLHYAYQVASALLFPAADHTHTSAQWDGVLCFLQFLQELFALERSQLPFDPRLDFSFCTQEELRGSSAAEEYRQF